jgi:hypothetical protein
MRDRNPLTSQRSRRAALACALLSAVLFTSCGGGSSSPTAPSGLLAVVATVVLNQNGVPTLLDVRLVLDGTVVGGASGATPGQSAILLDQGSAIASGHHTLSVLVAAQTVSPSPYQVLAPDVSIFNSAGVRIQDIKLPDRSASLATGQSIDYTFDF